MGGAVKKVLKFESQLPGGRGLTALGVPNAYNVMYDKTDAAEAAQAQSDAQAQAVRAAAEVQANATRQASAAQVQQVQQQSAATTAAQTASINQAAIAAQLAERAANAPQEGAPDVQLGTGVESNDPRRKFMINRGVGSLGGSSGGVGIRL